MKKIVILILCALLFQSCDTFWDIVLALTELGTPYSETIKGQKEERERREAEMRLDMGMGCVEGDESFDDPISGQIGIEKAILLLNKTMSIKSGLAISYQGAKYTEHEISGTMRLSYLSMPFLFDYRSDNGIYGEIGLQPGYLLSARDRIENSESWSYRDFVKKFELGIPLGGGYWINDDLAIGARGIVGLTNIQNWGSAVSNHNWMITGVLKYKIPHRE